VRILGDLPYYVSHDSADVWSHRDRFRLDARGEPRSVAGVPPDYFSSTGQLWGNPVYDWPAMADDGFAWWRRRMRRQLDLFDAVRIDHFRGFAAYWSVPAEAETAASGEWVEGPGFALFERLRDDLGALPLVAEDLGMIDRPVRDLLAELDLPGIRVLQFAFHEDEGSDNPHLPANHPERALATTGTHDNNTLRGWFEDEASADERRRFAALVGRPSGVDRTEGGVREIVAEGCRAVLGSRAELAVLPLQDLLALGSAARSNRPGEAFGNWEWRATDAALGDEPCERLWRMTEEAGRH
jgi:4-alpha-glucanotransferase